MKIVVDIERKNKHVFIQTVVTSESDPDQTVIREVFPIYSVEEIKHSQEGMFVNMGKKYYKLVPFTQTEKAETEIYIRKIQNETVASEMDIFNKFVALLEV